MYRESLGSVQYVCWLCGHDAFIAKILWGHISHQQYYPAPAPAPAPPWQWPWAGAGGGHITCLIISSYIMLRLCGDWQPCSLSPVSTYTFRDIATYATEISFYFRMQTCDFRISIERLTGEKEKACVHDISSVQVKSRSFYPNIECTTDIHT